jgi:hypothetical protein
MKKYIQNIAIGLIILSSASYLHAYRYTFSNHTQYPLLVGVKLCCAFEDLVSKIVKPDRMITFVHGQDFPDIKFGYCLQSISYVKNPTLKNKIKPETAPWTEINTTWLKTETYNDIIDFAEAIGEGAEETGKLIAKLAVTAGTASATGGASLAAGAAAEGISQTTEANQPTETATPTKKKSRSFELGRISKGLARLISITTCRDRHWDIYEDENGKIIFVSKVQQ